MKLKINQDYLHRHLFVTILMFGLGCWFGYDGLIRYPAISAGDLYRSIEKNDPPAEMDLEAFKKQKTKTQYGFAILSLLASLVVGLRLGKAACFNFEFDENGFKAQGRAFSYSDIRKVDRSLWEKKSILILEMNTGDKIVLDAWHHLGVKDFATKV